MGTNLTPAKNAADAWNMLTVEPLPSNDKRYLDCSVVRGINVAQTLSAQLQLCNMTNQCMHLLFTGYRGDGKTTELYRFMDKITDRFRPLYFDAQDQFDLKDFRFPDFLLGCARAVFERMEKQKLGLPDELLEDVANWFSKIVEVVERKTSAELKAEVGGGIPDWFRFITAKLVDTIKTGEEKRVEVRKELNQQLTNLIVYVDKLLAAAKKVSKQKDNREIVIIFDSLDRLTPELALDLFYTNGENLCDLHCHFVYVVPLSLKYHPKSNQLPFETPITMQMIPAYDRKNHPQEQSISHLIALLKRRFVPEDIITEPDELMREFILASGGHLRDLVRMFREACRDAFCEPGGKITRKMAQRRINMLCESYQNSVNDDDYPHLIETYKTKEADNNEQTQQLIFNTVILVYTGENAVTWKDVHPALAQGQKFQKLLQGSEDQ